MKEFVKLCSFLKIFSKVSWIKMIFNKEMSSREWVNPLMLTAAKTSLTLLKKSVRY